MPGPQGKAPCPYCRKEYVLTRHLETCLKFRSNHSELYYSQFPHRRPQKAGTRSAPHSPHPPPSPKHNVANTDNSQKNSHQNHAYIQSSHLHQRNDDNSDKNFADVNASTDGKEDDSDKETGSDTTIQQPDSPPPPTDHSGLILVETVLPHEMDEVLSTHSDLPASITFSTNQSVCSELQSNSVVEQSFLQEDPPSLPTEITVIAEHILQDSATKIPTEMAPDVSPEIRSLKSLHPFLGSVVKKPPNHPDYDAWRLEDKSTKSMLRLIDYCDEKSGNSRTFLDGLLELIAEEIKLNQFDPATAPKRRTLSKHIISRYGRGLEPLVK